MAWLEVSLTVNGEAAEAVADLLARFAPDGVALRPVSVEHHLGLERDELRVSDDMVVSAYLPLDANLDSARTQLEESLWHLGQLLPLPSPAYKTIVDTDWGESWKVNFRPLRVGRRLMIVPAWLNPPLAPDDIEIRLDPGMAFGTGTHPSTGLCLKIIERHLAPGAPMLDLGTGSAGENIQTNGVADRVQVAKASLAEVQAGQFGASWLSTPLVVANILASVIVPLLEQGLAGIVAPGGLLVLAGILDKQAYRVIAALEAAGLTIVAQEQMEDWVAIIARK